MEYIIQNIDNINNINQLPREFNYDNINNLITILSDYNKKLLLLSCLNEVIIIGSITFNINTLINLILRQYNMGFIIYPLNLNIIHFILFNKLDINILLKVIIFILYNKNELAISNGSGKCGSIGSINQPLNQADNIININLMETISYRKPNSLLKPLIKLMCESIDSNIININFNNNYEKLLLNELDINLEDNKDSIYLELINKIKELENKYEKLENKYEKLENKYEELLKTKIITIIE